MPAPSSYPQAFEDVMARPDVCPVLQAFVRDWYHSARFDKYDQWEALDQYLPLLPGTAGGPALAERRAWMAVDWLLRVNFPAWLDLLPLTHRHAAELRSLPPIASPLAAAAALALGQSVWTLEVWQIAHSAAWAAAESHEWPRARNSIDMDPDWDALSDAIPAAAWTAAEEAHADHWQPIWNERVRHYLLEYPGVLDGLHELAGEVAWVTLDSIARDAAAEAARAPGNPTADTVRLAAYRATRSFVSPTVRSLQAEAHDLLRRMIDEQASDM